MRTVAYFCTLIFSTYFATSFCVSAFAQAPSAVTSAPAQAAPAERANSDRAEVGISPPFLDINFEQAQKTQALRLFNLSGKKINVRVSVQPWQQSESGAVAFVPSSEDTIDQWVVLNPAKFSLTAGKSQVVRFSLRPAVQLPPGEHRFMMIFDEEEQADLIESDGEAQGAMQALFRIESAVYVQVGEPVRTGTIGLKQSSAKQLELSLSNTGNANTRIRGQAAIYPAVDYPGEAATTELPGVQNPDFVLPKGAIRMQLIPASPALPGNTRPVFITLIEALAPGKYVLDLNGRVGDTVLDRAFAFEIQAGKPRAAKPVPAAQPAPEHKAQ